MARTTPQSEVIQQREGRRLLVNALQVQRWNSELFEDPRQWPFFSVSTGRVTMVVKTCVKQEAEDTQGEIQQSAYEMRSRTNSDPDKNEVQ